MILRWLLVILLLCVVCISACTKHDDVDLPVNPPAPESYWYLEGKGFSADSLLGVSIDSQSAAWSYYSFNGNDGILILTILDKAMPGMRLTLNNNCLVEFIDPSFSGQQLCEYADTNIHPSIINQNGVNWFTLQDTHVIRWKFINDIPSVDTLSCSVKLRLDKL